MLLSGLLAALPADLAPICITGPLDRPIRAVSDHSQEVSAGDAFVAIQGTRSDGHSRIGGLPAAVFFTERRVQVPEGATLVQLPSTRRALPHLCAAAAGFPARAMRVIGITGTNGKTTTTFLLHAMTAACGLRPGLIGTTGNRIGDRLLPATHTTPDAARLQGLLREMQVSGVDIVAMEVSSIGLDSFRADAIPFAAAIFTNLSRDHLDYHGSMAAYAAAKARLFHELLAGRAILNCGDPAWAQMRPTAERPVWTFCGPDGQSPGMAPIADLRLEAVRMGPEGTSGWLVTPQGSAPLQMRLIGAYNIENALGAIGAALAVGLPLEGCLRGLAETAGAPGRLEPVPTTRGFSVRVDYAHTDDALARVLAELRKLGPRRILTVFGCGGDRDRGKRPLMGRAASLGSDRVFVTSDNPRSEDPQAIIDEILVGISGDRAGACAETRAQIAEIIVEPDRRTAIYAAIREAQPGDIVLIAGKGHEATQHIGAEVFPFDDRAVAAEALT